MRLLMFLVLLLQVTLTLLHLWAMLLPTPTLLLFEMERRMFMEDCSDQLTSTKVVYQVQLHLELTIHLTTIFGIVTTRRRLERL